MSQSGTPQPSGSTQRASRRGGEDDSLSLLDIEGYAKPPTFTTRQLAELEDISDVSEDKDVAMPSPPPLTSVDTNQALSASPATNAALMEIQRGASGSSTRRSARTPRSVDLAAILKEKVEAYRQVEAAAKAEAEETAETGYAPRPRPERGVRDVSSQSPDGSGKRAKGKEPMPNPTIMDTRQEKPAKNRPTSFRNMFRLGPSFCAVRIDDGKIMGNPFKHPMGWNVKINLEPGKFGQPSIGLNFKFSKDGIDSKLEDHCNTFALDWEPGVKINGKWMVEDFEVVEAMNPVGADVADTCPAEIKKLCDQNPKVAKRLVCAVFQSNVHKSSPVDVDWPLALKGDGGAIPHANLKRMYEGPPSYVVTVWFVLSGVSFERWTQSCFEPLRIAVQDHTPPFHQYLDENDEPIIDFSLPSIAEIGNGMYRPKVKDAAAHPAVKTPGSYHNLPKAVTWNSIRTFHITHGVPLVRNMKYTEGLCTNLESDWHGIFIEKPMMLSAEGADIQIDKLLEHTLVAGVRMARDSNNVSRSAVPPIGSTIMFDFYNGKPEENKEHETIEDRICLGRVDSIGGKAFLDKTGTDFCVALTKPRTRKIPWEKATPKAKLRVKVNHEATQRDIRALKNFCDEKFAPELLDHLRLALWSDPSRAATETIDLTKGPAHSRSDDNKARYMQILQDLKANRESNASQDRALNAATCVRNKIAVIEGPAGAGKTRTLREKAIALAKVGHHVLCVASSDVTVDLDARAVWSGLSPEERKTYKCLRLEAGGAERAQRLAKVNYAHYTGEKDEVDELPEAQDHPAIRNNLDKIVKEFTAHQKHADRMVQQHEDINQVYQAVEDYDAVKRSNVPNGMTLDYRIYRLADADRLDAEAKFNAAKDSLPIDEFNRQCASGEISVAMFDESAKYKACIADYIIKDGSINWAERTALEDEHDRMVGRVLEDTRLLFTTASGCGGHLLDESRTFVPTIIFCDEANQISVPSLCVPLTTFDTWEGLFMFGDIQQLLPTALTGRLDEFSANAKTSPLALLSIKGFPSIVLDTQYRMNPACSRFPREQFYDNKSLLDADVVETDNVVRQAIRQIFHDLGVTGDSGQGSEYVVVNVHNGCSRVEHNGTALVNHANADVIIRILETLLETKVIEPSMIEVLCYYQGQRRLLKTKINETSWSKKQKEGIEIASVDAFRGREARVVIVDTVSAKDSLKAQTKRELRAEEELDEGGEEFIKAGAVTAYLRSPNRLNVALTRAKDATIVVCQAALLTSSSKPERGKQYNAVPNMIGDADTRNCLLNDGTEDTHPEGIQQRAEMGRKRVDKRRKTAGENENRLIHKSAEIWEDMRKLPAIPLAEPLPRYRTR